MMRYTNGCIYFTFTLLTEREEIVGHEESGRRADNLCRYLTVTRTAFHLTYIFRNLM